jgi:hypothetical protein
MKFLPKGSWRGGLLTWGNFGNWVVTAWDGNGGVLLQAMAHGEGGLQRVSNGGEWQNGVLALWWRSSRRWWTSGSCGLVRWRWRVQARLAAEEESPWGRRGGPFIGLEVPKSRWGWTLSCRGVRFNRSLIWLGFDLENRVNFVLRWRIHPSAGDFTQGVGPC